MRTFVHFKDGVSFSWHSTEGDVEEGVEIFTKNPDDFLHKKYINGVWEQAPKIKFAILDESNTVVGIETTYFESDVKGKIITDDLVRVLWTWDEEKFVPPQVVLPVPTIIQD
jgi:hypothetical protein